jgi:ABC-type bacteriocin/lantibiotic exporter with double-glycine peptidase domain
LVILKLSVAFVLCFVFVYARYYLIKLTNKIDKEIQLNVILKVFNLRFRYL